METRSPAESVAEFVPSARDETPLEMTHVTPVSVPFLRGTNVWVPLVEGVVSTRTLKEWSAVHRLRRTPAGGTTGRAPNYSLTPVLRASSWNILTVSRE